MISKANFSITQLEYVWAVYKFGHFAKAAEACHVTQPTLSMQIQKLEDELGVVIFDRSKKPILLTEVGKQIIDQIQTVLSEAKKIEGIIESRSTGKIQGDLTLGIIPTIAPYILPRLLPVLEKSYPDIQLKILELQTQRIIESLDNDEIDVGLLAIPLKISKIQERSLYFEPFYALAKKDHPLTKLKKVKYSQLSYDDIWLLEEGHCLRHQILDICSPKAKKGSARRFQFESGSLETLKSLVNSYGGFTLVPALAVDQIGSQCQLMPFENPVPSREVGLVYQRTHYKSDLIHALGDTIVSCIPDQIKKIKAKDLDVLDID